jgi:hypothetical protein
MLESESIPPAGRPQTGDTGDEKECIVDSMFLAESKEKRRGIRSSLRRIEMDVKQAVGAGIDSSGRPISRVVELNHGLTNRNVLRISTTRRL